MFSMGFLGFSLYLLPGLFGAPLGGFDAYLPPRQASDVSLLTAMPRSADGGFAHDNDLTWYVDDLDSALDEARREDKPIFVDFTGYTCTNCREMEANIFPRPQVSERLARDFVRVKLYTDGREHGPTFQRYQLRLTGTVALPTYAVITADEELISRWSGMASVDQFSRFLREGHTRFVSTHSSDPPEIIATTR
jgi:thiol:disulfide interchange protein